MIDHDADYGHDDHDVLVDDPGLALAADDSSTVGLDHADQVDDGDFGDRGEYDEHWFRQATDGTCVPASVAQIVSEYTGVEYSDESAFVDYALDHGLFEGGQVKGGMTDAAAVQLLQAAGVPAHSENGDLATLEGYLATGHGVMLAVDSGEYWDPEGEAADEASGEDRGADHMVVVSEIDEEKGIVYLSDPGHPDGDMMAVPMEQFEQAWAESDNTMIVCDEPSPNAGDATADDTELAVAIDRFTATKWVLLPVVLGRPA